MLLSITGAPTLPNSQSFSADRGLCAIRLDIEHPKPIAKKVLEDERKVLLDSISDDYIFEDKLPKNPGTCNTPVNKILKLGKDLGISSTPTIILSNGRRIPGAIPYEKLEEYLQWYFLIS